MTRTIFHSGYKILFKLYVLELKMGSILQVQKLCLGETSQLNYKDSNA